MADMSMHILPEGYYTRIPSRHQDKRNHSEHTHATEMALQTRRPTVGDERDPVLAGYTDDLDDILRGVDLDDDGVG